MTSMAFLRKNILTAFLLIAFLAMTFFGFMAMSERNMESGCPFSVTGASLCQQDPLSMAIHHISAYGSFISVQVTSSTSALIAILLLIASSLLVPIMMGVFVLKPPVRGRQTYRSPPLSARTGNIGWLSLLENSPSAA